MANLQVKNVPDSLHRRIRQQAKRQGRTVRDLVLDAVRKEVERTDFYARLEAREPVSGISAAQEVEAGRVERDLELGRRK